MFCRAGIRRMRAELRLDDDALAALRERAVGRSVRPGERCRNSSVSPHAVGRPPGGDAGPTGRNRYGPTLVQGLLRSSAT
ncbi:hypothetical protein FHR84_002667 [Actinopolyspora biskrensis]|uniref:Uncharacterized protein n=1 Tax=Actinopolyspora biskrensis TaxID=1470178 RepID=A0A852ZB99_9ACTN|nr:hypothetical protein [Actinopolyspora biskrensis]